MKEIDEQITNFILSTGSELSAAAFKNSGCTIARDPTIYSSVK
jgi:hypothetical protein